ncbi:hypothetical protein [Kordiimonas gwangyangensis]|uniref:hypothetical protein n=1 Tax=Kordiimonas gwangyangensis TaxID=288022 RepID=UPI00192E6DAD|nr:hypothetical protein [Kordiimonas gwangyangensis]
MHPVPGSLGNRAQGRDGGAFAVGARHMDDGRQFFVRVIQFLKQAVQPVKRQVYLDRV